MFLLFVLAAGAAQSSAPAREQVELIATNDLDHYVVTTKDGLAVHPAFTSPESSALIVRRDRSGEVERHAAMNDIMVARTGRISILLGGTIKGGREVSPGEWRGGEIIGGSLKSFSAGDVMWIPAGIPHQMILPKGGSFTYLAIKVPAH